MPYPSGGPPRVPTTRQIVVTELEHADGQIEAQMVSAKIVGPSGVADVDSQAVQRQVELACGCYSPPAAVVGVCDACVQSGEGGNVCRAHYFVCCCGAPCCWRHSRATENPAVRFCERCHLRSKSAARSTCVGNLVRRAVKRIFLGDTVDGETQA